MKQTLTNLPVPRTENVGSILERDLDRTIAFRMGVVKKDGAYEHRMLRREPGYTVPMLMEESRILQGIIFKIPNNNLPFSRCQKAPARRHPYCRRTGLAIETGDFRLLRICGGLGGLGCDQLEVGMPGLYGCKTLPMIVARLLRALKTKPSGASCFFDAPKGRGRICCKV